MADEWAVYRLDFSGNHFLIEQGLSESRARELVQEFEAHKHHQHYWAERLPAEPPDFVAMLRESLCAGSPLEASLRILRNQHATEDQCIQAVATVRDLAWEEARQLVAPRATDAQP